MELARLLGCAHPMLVHCPLVLLPLALLVDFTAWWKKSDRLSWCGYWLTILGVIGGVCAFVCGILAELFAARTGVPTEMIEVHEWMATFAIWTFIGVAVLRILQGVTLSRKVAPIYLVLSLVACAFLVVAAHRGGQVTYSYGANVGYATLQRLPHDEDLATLAQHQREDTLQYSNQMHWIFGGIVLMLALSVLLERLPLGRLRELRRLMPLVFIGGGIYLFIWSDWDSWPLSKLRPVTDPEVLLHKAIAILLVVMGVLTARKPKNDSAPGSVWQNRVIAVMAAIGGGLLFTHIHTNAPYTNVAVGVYLNHTALGLAAFAVAASVLMADAFPASRKVALLFPLALALEGGLLFTYNEDLPWFLGYGKISNLPVHGGVLSHVEPGRGELTFDGKTGRLDLYFWGSHDDKPTARPEAQLPAVIEARQHEFPAAFTRVDEGHYQLQHEWLRSVPVFNVRLIGPLAVSFDPIVTAPLLPPLEGVEKVWACPMCPDVLSSVEGECFMCGMKLEALATPRLKPPVRPPHDEGFDMKLSVDGKPEAGKAARLRFTLENRGKVVESVRIVHEKPMHTIIVRDDLSGFDHVHPDRQPDGSYAIDYTFPSGGSWLVFSEAAPCDSRGQGFRLPVAVEGPAPSPTPQRLLDALQQQGDYTFSLDTGSLPVRAGIETPFSVTVCEKGRPVEDLGTWLGAVGHCVIISADTHEFVHAHSLQLAAAATPAGPTVSFHARLPRPGRYRMWVQLCHRGSVLTTDFDISAR